MNRQVIPPRTILRTTSVFRSQREQEHVLANVSGALRAEP
jgi:hypothetical protein